MRDLSSLLLALVAASSAASAQGGIVFPRPPDGVVMTGTRDSAGIRIVDNSRQAWSATSSLRLSPAPDLRIGDRDGPAYEFSGIRGAARLSDGRIAVVNGSTRQIRFYDSTGTFIKAVGRQGDGPGEMRDITSAQFLADADTIVLIGRSRTSFFDGDGVHVSAVELQAAPNRGAGGIRQVVGVMSSAARITAALGNPAPRTKGDRWVESFALAIIDRAGAITADLRSLPGMEFAMDEYPRPVWLGASEAFANDDDTFYTGLGTEYSIRAYGRDGTLRSIIRRSWTPHRITPDEIDMYVREWGKRWIKSSGAKAEAERQDLRDDPYAVHLPAFSQLIVDRGRRVWAREPNVIDAAWAGQLDGVPLAPSRWSVFDEGGRWLGVVTMPARFMPMDIGLDYVIGVARDDDDVERVVKYRLRAGSPTRD
jgi:hypothetical protein